MGAAAAAGCGGEADATGLVPSVRQCCHVQSRGECICLASLLFCRLGSGAAASNRCARWVAGALTASPLSTPSPCRAPAHTLLAEALDAAEAPDEVGPSTSAQASDVPPPSAEPTPRSSLDEAGPSAAAAPPIATRFAVLLDAGQPGSPAAAPQQLSKKQQKKLRQQAQQAQQGQQAQQEQQAQQAAGPAASAAPSRQATDAGASSTAGSSAATSRPVSPPAQDAAPPASAPANPAPATAAAAAAAVPGEPSPAEATPSQAAQEAQAVRPPSASTTAASSSAAGAPAAAASAPTRLVVQRQQNQKSNIGPNMAAKQVDWQGSAVRRPLCQGNREPGSTEFCSCGWWQRQSLLPRESSQAPPLLRPCPLIAARQQ